MKINPRKAVSFQNFRILTSFSQFLPVEIGDLSLPFTLKKYLSIYIFSQVKFIEFQEYFFSKPVIEIQDYHISWESVSNTF